MKSILSCAVFLVVCASVVTSCKKGDTGPMGNANVMYSDWFTPATYTKDTVFGIWGFKYNKPAPGLTKNIVDSGTVLIYGKMLGYNPLVWPTNQVSQLPISITYMQGGVTTDTWTAFASEGNIRIRFVNDRNIYTTIANAHQFRYIIIPANTRATGGRVAQPTYEEICRQYNIAE